MIRFSNLADAVVGVVERDDEGEGETAWDLICGTQERLERGVTGGFGE